MILLVSVFPELQKEDYKLIQSYRSKFDKNNYKLVEPNISLISPAAYLDESNLVHHIEGIAKNFKEFYFVLRCALSFKDKSTGKTEVCLIPEEGFRIFIKLYEALHKGPLSSPDNPDFPFIPRLVMATSENYTDSKNVQNELNSKNIEIAGAISSLDIMSLENNSYTSIKKIKF
jgi:hypothetical protein